MEHTSTKSGVFESTLMNVSSHCGVILHLQTRVVCCQLQTLAHGLLTTTGTYTARRIVVMLSMLDELIGHQSSLLLAE